MKKLRNKVLPLILVIGIVLGGTIISANNEPNETALQDIVFVLNTAETDLENGPQTKNAAIDFAETVLSADKNDTGFAVIACDAAATTAGFVSSAEQAQTAIENAPSGDLSNLDSTMAAARTLLAEEGRENAKKTIVILNDQKALAAEVIDPDENYVPDEDGTPDDYDLDEDLLTELPEGLSLNAYEEDVDVYAVTYLAQSDVTSLLDSVANKGVSGGSSDESVESSLQDIAEDILAPAADADVNSEPTLEIPDVTAPADTNLEGIPVIYIPGFMSSRLFEAADCVYDNQVWPPKILGDSLSTTWDNIWENVGGKLGPDDNGNLATVYVRQPENQVTAESREYGMLNGAKNLIDSLCDAFPEREIYFYSYDFRQSTDTLALQLADFIDNTLQANKVDIICYSMGGLVASSYVAQGNADKVNTVVSLAAPYEGTPQALNDAVNLSPIGSMLSPLNIPLAIKGINKEVKTAYPSLGEMFPSAAYNAGENYTYRKNSVLIYKKYDADQSDIDRIAQTLFGSNYTNGQAIHNARTQNGATVLAGLEKSYFGVSDNVRTISSVDFLEGKSASTTFITGINYTSRGDGSVPYNSATNMGVLESIVGSSRIHYFDNVSHNSMTSNQESIDWIIDILQSNGTYADASTPNAAEPYVVITVEDAEDVKVSGGSGEISSDDEADEAGFGSVNSIGEDSSVQVIDLDDTEDYDITIEGGDSETINYNITWYDENDNVVDSRSVENIPVTEDTVITTNTDKDDDTVLNIDTNGDGETDTVITAEADEDVDAGGTSEKTSCNFIRALVGLFTSKK